MKARSAGCGCLHHIPGGQTDGSRRHAQICLFCLPELMGTPIAMAEQNGGYRVP
jgi:hypothetical protein